jgi:hypothetical protein
MTAPQLSALGGLLRDLGGLVPQVRVDVDPQTGQVLPYLPPQHLWRVLPRILRRAAQLAESIEEPPALPDCDPAAMRELALWIERGQKAGVPG